MKTFLKMMVAAIVAGVLACVLIAHDASDNAVITVYFCSAIAVSAVLGVFDVKAGAKTMRLKDAAREMRDAA